ncbi:LysR family transcriptional regulator [Acinetobacter lwoffii]|uniref:LysR family transcriptional regulator n=1 Tax=Acinetobacter lwoffii TaxID=28090 RepID=A0AAW8B0Y3_ACILW|nr:MULTISPECIES: LysR family transcriptional regulator [Acinetobacter]MDP1370780.1 LysR family transcriptional regulator [Acinetobacter lwoffii]MDP1390200.1 LysR family transcriptional regulator [Acinetobacter lwoffii]MDP1447818.1 LysR family transcriptional regulator [Acinetobacter lwoffii]
MNFDLNDFRLILNIAETQNLTRAAEKTFISTPAASNRIKNLEQQLGLKILERSSQGVRLTEIGQIYLKYAKAFQHEIECLKGELSQFNNLIQGKLTIAANTTAITEYIPNALSEYLITHPHVDVNLKEMTSEEIIHVVADRQVDLGIISGDIDTDHLQTLPLISSQLVLIAPKMHPLLEIENITLIDIIEYSVVTLNEGSAIQQFLYKLALQLDKKINIRVQVSSYDSICQMVAAGAGISIIPLAAFQRLQHIHPQLACTKINEKWAQRSFKICSINFNQISQFSKDFIQCLQAHIH